MTKLVECVPNFSEGRDKAAIEAIVAAAKSVPGVQILDIHMDPDHHRSVLSFVAPPEAAVEAAFRSAAKARELIDLTRHKGGHPRMGAADVIPFIPLSDATIGDCVRLARNLAERIGRDLQIPVYLYGRAAQRPERRDLAQVRKGQFEGLREEIGQSPERDPDFGPRRVHPTAGAVAVGAREQIINFNINLIGLGLEDAKGIARKIRASGGGLPCLRAKEIDLASRRQIQISTVLTDYSITGMVKVYDSVQAQAAAVGAQIVSTQIVGLIPRRAFVDVALEKLQVENFDPGVQVLENRLEFLEQGWEAAAARLALALASTEPTPGGGSAAGVAGQMGCALGEMAVGISLESKKITEKARRDLSEALIQLRALREALQRLTGEDAVAFNGFMEAMKLPKEDPTRGARMQAALSVAAQVPMKTAREARTALRAVLTHAASAAATVSSDMNCAAHLLRAAALCALENVEINLSSLKDHAVAAALRAEVEAMRKML